MPGPGLLARTGDLAVLCGSADGGEDLLLAALNEIAAAGGDATDLVRRATRAALEQERPPSWACAGVTSAGAIAVLVHGEATALITMGEESVTMSGEDTVIPVSRLFAGAVDEVVLTLPGHGDPDHRLRLDDGVIQAGGVSLTVLASADGLVPGPAPQPAARAGQDTAPMPADEAPAQAPAAQPAQALPPQPPWPPEPVLRQPDPAARFESVLLILSDDDQPAPPEPPDPAADGQVLIDGVYCPQPKIRHFNDPAVAYCRVCGLGMLQLTRQIDKGPRPPLGVLLLDDGMTFRLDADYVLGRDPEMDADVAAGRARPLRVVDPGGTISRLHLRVSLHGWRVQVADLGSANGSVVHHPGGAQPQRLTPREPVEIKPGAAIDVGRRTVRFESYLSS
jgi:FHA domain